MKMLVVAFAALMMIPAMASSTLSESECSTICPGDAEYGAGKDWFCIAKDSCGHSYLPECGAICKDHAIDSAVKMCAENSEDPESCEVIKSASSCSKNRRELADQIGG